jgi:hypothetical protein
MAAWKVLLIVVLGSVCLGLAMATVVVPMTLTVNEGKWLWFAGLLVATLVMSTLFALFLRHQDRTFGR